MRKLAFLSLATLLVLSAGCANMGTDGEQAASAAAIQAAEQAVKAAGKVGGEWRDTGKTLGKARKAHEAGDYAAAIKLANKAKAEGEMGEKQAMSEKNAGMPGYVYAK